MQESLARPGGWRLQYILIIGFVLTTAITVVAGALIMHNVIRNYLDEATNARVGRDMDLANAFYNNKLSDILSTAKRISSVHNVQCHLAGEAEPGTECAGTIEKEIDREIATLPAGSQRFIVVLDAEGKGIAGRIASNGEVSNVSPDTDWSQTPIVNSARTTSQAQAATEVLPADVLSWLGLQGQAAITLIDTPKAALQPFDAREGTAGLVLMGAAPVIGDEGEYLGLVLVGHLFNKDYTLVDRIKEVAGVDTATIFFGDLRVSTNVQDEAGDRAIGTRVSQEVFDQVLVRGEEFTGRAFVVNQWYLTRYQPLYDHLGNVVGMLYVGAQEAAFQRLVDSFARQVFLIAGASILLAVIIAIPLALSISRPLTNQATATRQVAEGDWSVRVPVESYREMRTLAASFNTMVETLEETQEQLIQKEKLASVGQLAAGVAHEINNPLGSVLLYADILRKETPEEEKQRQEDLEMIIREATRCKMIVNDLLNFSRQNEVLAQDTDLNALLEQLVESARRQELFKGIEIVTELDPSLNTIQADPLQLDQLFINLMNNAAEAMPDGGRLTLRTRRGQAPGYATVEVEDTGVGIPEENMKRLFTPFFTTKPIGQGTGLGLAIIYGIVKMHRGQISVHSEVGKGTTFTIALREKLPGQMEQAEGSFVLQ